MQPSSIVAASVSMHDASVRSAVNQPHSGGNRQSHCPSAGGSSKADRNGPAYFPSNSRLCTNRFDDPEFSDFESEPEDMVCQTLGNFEPSNLFSSFLDPLDACQVVDHSLSPGMHREANTSLIQYDLGSLSFSSQSACVTSAACAARASKGTPQSSRRDRRARCTPKRRSGPAECRGRILARE